MSQTLRRVGIALFSILIAKVGSAAELKVSSKILKPGAPMAVEQVFNGFGCTGGNVSPDLKWSGAPKDTKAFAVTAFDPDAPTGSGWWHWVVFNIPASVTALPAKAGDAEQPKLPNGAIQSRTDFGKPGYGGPCPPPGDKAHRYIFKVFALKDTLPLDANAPGAMVGYYLNQLKLAEGQIEATYARP